MDAQEDAAGPARRRERARRRPGSAGAWVSVVSSVALVAIVMHNVMAGRNAAQEGGGFPGSRPDLGAAVEPQYHLSPGGMASDSASGRWYPWQSDGDGTQMATVWGLTVATADPAAALDRLGPVAIDLGGHLVSSSLHRYDPSQPLSAQLSVRVPAAQAGAFVSAVQAEGVLLSRQSYSSDVSGAIVDIGARLESLRLLERELQSLLGASSTDGRPDRPIEIFRQLADARTEIEQLQRAEASLARQVAFDLIDVRLEGTERPFEPSGAWTVSGEVRDAVADLLHAGRRAVSLGVRTLVFALPLLPLGGFLWYRRRTSGRASGRASGQAGSHGAEPHPGPVIE
jgi:hypothetical protein